MKRWIRAHSAQVLLLAMLAALCVLLSVRGEHFLSAKNAKNILESITFRLILAVGMNFVIASGAIDLSAGAMVSLCGIVMGYCLSRGAAAGFAVTAGLMAGVAMGCLNGAIIHASRLNSFIVTLATSSIYRGLSLIITKGMPFSQFPQEFLALGKTGSNWLNPPVAMALTLFVIAVPLMYRTRWGEYVRALGGNPEALRLVGVRCWVYRVSVHGLLGIAAALTALITVARLNSAEANAGIGMELDAIAAVIMGGTLMSGGTASLFGTLIAVLLLGVMRNGLTMLTVSSYYQTFLVGIILLISVLISEGAQRRRDAR